MPFFILQAFHEKNAALGIRIEILNGLDGGPYRIRIYVYAHPSPSCASGAAGRGIQ